MKPYQLLAMFLFPFFASCRQQVPEEPRISIFADHIVTAALDRLFAASAKLGHAFDTGNYLYCGEDVLPALEHFRDRIGHVHLKDRRAKSDAASVPVGAGIVPVDEVVAKLLESGYDGWFTVEQYGSAQMLEDAAVSIRNVRNALAGAPGTSSAKR